MYLLQIYLYLIEYNPINKCGEILIFCTLTGLIAAGY